MAELRAVELEVVVEEAPGLVLVVVEGAAATSVAELGPPPP